LYVNDPDFDNFDNPFAEIKLHRYTNMNDKNDTNKILDNPLDNPIKDEVLNIKECEEDDVNLDLWN